jgi:ATP-dependent DNA helicase RecQ
VEAALAGRDVLAVMPTGSGKSLCYQLPALAGGPGVTIVVSPLIALMEDQHEALRARGIEAVDRITSAMDASAVAAALERLADGRSRLVYVAPERFSSRRFLEALARARIARLVVDEAHCLSEWGHDFRPDYLRLADVRARLGSPPTMALTATATPRVRGDIVRALALRDPLVTSTGFDRPNLFFEVRHVRGDAGKRRALLELVRDGERLPALVYCGTRRASEDVARLLADAGLRSAAYHAGLGADTRTARLAAFLAGDLDAIAATTAFGMGIDKPDVRAVIHWSLPPSPEEYYQQAGRAGRDGAPARCTLLFSPEDKGLAAFFIQKASLSADELRATHRALAARADERGAFAIGADDIPADAAAALAVLERAGALELFPAPRGRFAGRLAAPRLAPAQLGAALAAVRRTTSQRWERLRAIEGYARAGACRREALLAYFGDRPAPRPAEQCCDGHAGTAAGGRVARGLDDLRGAVMRAVDETGGRVGRSRLTQILTGSSSRAVATAGHDRLLTFGALGHLRQSEVLAVIDGLVRGRALEVTGGPYPLVRRPAGAGQGASPAGRPDPADGPDAAPREPPAAAAPARDPAAAVLAAVDETAGRAGRTRLAQILTGSTGASLRDAGHDRLATYGALSHLRQSEVLAVIDGLLERGTLESTGGPYPLVRRRAVA